MAQFIVEDETEGRPKAGSAPVVIEGLAVAKAIAKQKIAEGSRIVIVRSVDTGETVARYEAPLGQTEEPSLANSVRRMRAANDRLKEALVPLLPKKNKKPA